MAAILYDRWVAAQSVFYHLYNQVSYMSLDEISPLTFSIGNTMKRISVIVSSIIIFHTPVQPINALGAAVAILGTFLYSQVTNHTPDFYWFWSSWQTWDAENFICWPSFSHNLVSVTRGQNKDHRIYLNLFWKLITNAQKNIRWKICEPFAQTWNRCLIIFEKRLV